MLKAGYREFYGLSRRMGIVTASGFSPRRKQDSTVKKAFNFLKATATISNFLTRVGDCAFRQTGR